MVAAVTATAMMALDIPQEELNIRPLEVVDLEVVATIEQLAHDHPWKKSIHLSCIEQEYPSLVLEKGAELIAYTVFNYLYDECHLMNITTHPKFQGQGFASLLIKRLYQDAKVAGMKSILLEVRESNIPALMFYNKEGFDEIGRRPEYYPKGERRETAVVMQKSLGVN